MKNKTKLILTIIILAQLSCFSPSRKQQLTTIEDEIIRYVNLSNIKNIYVFDEYSCGICSDNLFNEINNEANQKNYTVLYSEKNFLNYEYENSILYGYVSREKITPVPYEIIQSLRKETNTTKGNYKLTIHKKQIKTIKTL